MEKEAEKKAGDGAGGATRTTSVFLAVSEVLSLLIYFSGCAVLMGWALDIPELKSVCSGCVTMKANTALAFAFAGAALGLLQLKWRENKLRQRIALVFSFVVFSIGLLTLLEYLTGWNLGIDQLLFKELPGAILTSSPGRMAFNTALNFTITGFALFLWVFNTRRCLPVQIVMFPVALTSATACLGYLYKANPLLIGLRFSTAMALHTIALFLAVFVAVFFSRPGCGIMKLVSSEALGGRLFRRLLPIALLLPPVLGFLKIQGERNGVFSNELGVSLVAILNLIILSSVVSILSVWINKLDKERDRVTQELHTANAELEARVSLRTAELSTAVKEMEAFSYSVAHDLKAPLRAISGFAVILAQDYAPKLDANGKRVIGVITDSVAMMGRLIDDLLRLAHLTRVEIRLADLDLAALVQSVCRELREVSLRDRVLEVSVKPLPPALADAMLARQIFTNLISNAIKFTAHAKRAMIEIGSDDKDGERVYYVKDNGAGFDMKYAEKLFGIFQRLHTQEEFAGTGIGLAIVRSAVRRHGGRVWAEAKVGQGATFYFTLSGRGVSPTHSP